MLLPALQNYLQGLKPSVSPARKEKLDQLAKFIQDQLASGQPADLIFICTHNSRRSHFAQVWAQVLALSFGLKQVNCYSGGTEATAAHPNTLRALEQAGFQVSPLSQGPNPRQRITYGQQGESFEIWSKRYGEAPNPKSGFCAIMTCSEADEACPIVFGAAERIALPFEDPKLSDATPEEAQVYAARCRQIAEEMWYVFSQLTLNKNEPA